jgi:hypothetical protein
MKTILNYTFLFSLIFLFANKSVAQFNSIDIDINDVKAKLLDRGDMFWHPSAGISQYEYPKGSGKQSNFATSIWVSGFDTANVLHVSAQTYRQSGNDYWSGPLDNNDSITLSDHLKWNRFWKLNVTTLDSFLAISTHTNLNTNPVILEWPAFGNPFCKDAFGNALSITEPMAEFVDVDGDNIYNALLGDYPKMYGEQMIWRVFSDNGPTHNETDGLLIKFQAYFLTYACNSIPSLKSIIFHKLNVVNKSNIAYHNVRIGIWSCIDLGNGWDDYIGFDSVRKMAIVYNGDSFDDGTYGYGSNLTQHGCIMLKSPSSDIDAFTYYNNDFSPYGNPSQPIHYSNYMHALWKNNASFTKTCNGYDSSTVTNYIFTDEPFIAGGNSEIMCNNMLGDRRFVLSSSDFNMVEGDTKEMVFADINTPVGSNNATFTVLKKLADSALAYINGCGSGPTFPTAVATLSSLENEITIFPNPIYNELNISFKNNHKPSSYQIINSLGEIIYQENSIPSKINVSKLSVGIYYLQLVVDGNKVMKKFVKM